MENEELVRYLIEYFNNAAGKNESESALFLMAYILLAAHMSKNVRAIDIVARLNNDENVKGLELIGKELRKQMINS